MTYRPAPHLIEDVVNLVRINYSEAGILPYYEFGVTTEVVNKLKKKTASSTGYDKKYPLIWYLIDGSIYEKINTSKTNPREIQSISIIFCMATDVNYSSDERYENTFIPVLRPLYEMFMFYLKKSKALKSTDRFYHDYYENLFWGRDGLYGHQGNIFDDRLDAIIIEGLNLRIIESCLTT